MTTYYSGDPDGMNMKERAAAKVAARNLKPYFEGLKSPIPMQIKDAEEYMRFFKAFPETFIPFAGTDSHSGHGLLGLLLAMRELSPTQSGVLKAMKEFALSGKIDLVNRPDETFDLGDEQIASDADKRAFVEFAQEVTWRNASGSKCSPREIGMWLHDDLKSCGNAYLEVVQVETLGQRSVYIDLLSPEDCLYLATKPGEDRIIGISPIWRLDYVQRNPPRYVPVYPVFSDEGNGISRTVIHVKTGNYPWYGRPDSLGSLNYQYFEFQNSDYLNKAAYSQFAGQVFIEVEDEDLSGPSLNELAEQDGFFNLVDQVNKNMTSKADDLQTVVVSTRPYGAKPAFVFQFAPNTNENWYAVTNEEAERQILKSHAFPKRLIGLDAASGLSSNVFLDTLKVFSPTVFRSIQEVVEKPINLAYRLAGEFLGSSIGEDLSMRFTSPYRRLMMEADQSGQSQENASDGNNDE